MGESLFKKFIRNNLGRNICNIKISEYEGTTTRKRQIEKWPKDLNSNFRKKFSIYKNTKCSTIQPLGK